MNIDSMKEIFELNKESGKISKKRCVKNYCLFDKVFNFSFIRHILKDLSRKDERHKIYKQTGSTFYTSNDLCLQINMLRRKNISYVIFIKPKYIFASACKA